MPVWCVNEMLLVWIVLGLIIAFMLGVAAAIVRW
jgi:hypothetical protein